MQSVERVTVLFLYQLTGFHLLLYLMFFRSRFLRITVYGSVVCNIFFMAVFLSDRYDSCSKSKLCCKVIFTWRFIIFNSVGNFTKKFGSSSFGSCLLGVKFFIKCFYRFENVLRIATLFQTSQSR